MTGPRPLPEADELTAPFWEAAARHVLTIPRCSRCDGFSFPPDIVCPQCGTTDPAFEFMPVEGRGTVRSWTVVRQSFLPGFDDLLPFVLVDVELTEQPSVRLIGRLLDGVDAIDRTGTADVAGTVDARLRLGAEVALVFDDVAPGVSLPAFELVRS